MSRQARQPRPPADATVPNHRLCKYVEFVHAGSTCSLVVAFDPDGVIEGVVPAARPDGLPAPTGGIGDVAALVSMLLTYGVSLDRIADALGRDAGAAPLAQALVAFLARVETAEGAMVRSRYLASELARLSAVGSDLAR